jgi:hypothetical protein
MDDYIFEINYNDQLLTVKAEPHKNSISYSITINGSYYGIITQEGTEYGDWITNEEILMPFFEIIVQEITEMELISVFPMKFYSYWDEIIKEMEQIDLYTFYIILKNEISIMDFYESLNEKINQDLEFSFVEFKSKVTLYITHEQKSKVETFDINK